MDWAALAPGIILILLGLSLLLLALLGTGRKKTFTVPVINASFLAPSTRGQKIGVGLIGLALLGLGIYLLVIPLQTESGVSIKTTESPTANATQVSNSSPTAIWTETPLPTPTNTVIPLPTSTPTPMCPYQGDSDTDTMTNLIKAEAEAVNTKNIDIIKASFDPAAIIIDQAVTPPATPQTWPNSIDRYMQLFNTNFKDAQHFDIRRVGPVNQTLAWFVSGSKGSYQAGGVWKTYFNPSPSDHWTFEKKETGCSWVIINFTFNASHIQFPP